MIFALILILGVHSTTNLKTYEQGKKISLTQQIHNLHLKNPLRKNVMRLLVCVPFSLGSICEYWIYVVDDIGVFRTLSNISKIERFAEIVNG